MYKRQHLVQVYFVRQTAAFLEDLIEPDLRSKHLSTDNSGDPAISSVTITGPYDALATDDSHTRRRIFVCRPADGDEVTCAKHIIATLARRAYRRPVTDVDLQIPLELYGEAARTGGFESGIEVALRGILVSPEFLFRFESQPANVAPNTVYRVSDLDLASRLSFFLWSSIPDDELVDLSLIHI